MSKRNIQTVTVLGAGTMGSGIAAACASAGCETVLLDVSAELAQRGKENMLAGRMPMLDDASAADLISTGGFDDSLEMASNSDWVCEAVVEDLEVKRAIFSRLEQVRKPGSIISTNTSGNSASINLQRNARTVQVRHCCHSFFQSRQGHATAGSGAG